MRLFIDGNRGANSNGLIKKQLRPEVSPSARHTSAPTEIGSEQNTKATIDNLDCQLRQKEEEIIKPTVEISEKTKQLKSELHEKEIRLNAKEEQVRRPNRRNKLRVYLP